MVFICVKNAEQSEVFNITIFRETLFSKKIIIEANDPLSLAVKIVEEITKKHKIKNKIDNYETNGNTKPKQRFILGGKFQEETGYS